MISYGFIVLAAIFNACMDSFESSPNFNESIFSHLNKKFWCKDISWQYAKKIGMYKLDSWHISKTLMIFCWAAAVITMDLKHEWWVIFGTIGAIWIAVFNATYHLLFKVK